MQIQTSLNFEAQEPHDEIFKKARAWAEVENFKLISEGPTKLVYQRGGGLIALFTFDIRKLATTVEIELIGQNPTRTIVKYDVRSVFAAETKGDRKRVEEQLSLIVAKLKGAV